ncbi:band 4.1-like protein 4 [Diadema antillarum]|uniref:band 4.1-like protein 4 n=1 Tax=Diadema antillarum TaxID=105358 RepID=UPI003A84AE96
MACCGSQTADTHCSIQLLNGTEVNMNIQRKMIGGDVLDRVFNHLNMVELDYFGLRFVDNDNQTKSFPARFYDFEELFVMSIINICGILLSDFCSLLQHWLHPEKSVLKQLKHVSTKTLYFGVKFYVEDPCKLSEEVTRYQFFLQLKMDMLQGRLPCSFGQAADLCAYAAQSELGDYSAEMHPDGYVSEFRFIPNQTEDLEKAITANHKRLRGLLPAKAELGFLDRAKRLEMYGVDLYPVQGEDHVEYFLGTTPQGVVVYRNKSKVATYYWSKIRQMNFRQTEFKIIVEDKEYTWQLPSRASCKHLFQCYIEQHMFFRLRPSMLERNGTLTKSLKSNGSRYSFRTQEEALQYSLRLRRPEPQVHRVPSRRYLRRVSANDADDSVYVNHSSLMMSGGSPALEEDGISIVPGWVTKTVAPEPVQRSQSQLGGRDSPTSGTSVRSVPWEDTDGGMSDRGMYTQRGESPVSMRSAHRSRRPHSRSSSPGQTRRRHRHSDRSGSETESVSSRKYRYRRSLTGSEASEDEMTHRRRRRRRSRSRDSSGSEGENRHRTRRSRSRDHMVDSEAQWTAVQAGEGGQRGEVREPGDAVVKNLKNGYDPTEASDGYKWYKERSQLEDIKASTELRKHIQLGLQDPSAEEDLQNIAYTKVVTEDGVAIRVSHSANRPRSRPSSGAYRRSRGEFTEENESVHSGKGSMHSKRSTVSRRTDPGPQRNGSYRHSMPLDLIETGPDARSTRPPRPVSYYESDNQRDGRRHRRQREESNRDRSGSGSTVGGGGGGGHEELPSYLSAQRGQGMFGQQQRADSDRYSSAINQSEMQSQQSAPPYEAVMSSQQSRREDKVASLPPSYAPPPRYVSSHQPVAGGNTNASSHLSSRLESIHSREDSGFEQEEVSYGTRGENNSGSLYKGAPLVSSASK